MPVLFVVKAIARPSWDLGLESLSPRTLCSDPRPREELLALGRSGSLDRPSSSRWTRCALTNGEDAGHVVVDVRLATERCSGDLLRLRDHDRDLAPDTWKRRSASGGEQGGGRPGSGHTRPQKADRRRAGSTQARSPDRLTLRGCV